MRTLVLLLLMAATAAVATVDMDDLNEPSAADSVLPFCAHSVKSMEASEAARLGNALAETLAAQDELVLIRGALTERWLNWPAMRWSWEDLIEIHGESASVGPVWLHNGSARTFAKGDDLHLHDDEIAFWKAAATASWQSFSHVVLSARGFFGAMAAAEQGQDLPDRLYWNTEPSWLKHREADVSPFMPLMVGEPSGTPRSLWISSPGTTTHSHWDRNCNLFTQLRGTKRFTLVALADIQRAYPFSCLHPQWSQFQVDLLSWNATRFPALAEMERCYTVDVGPGDMLFIPPYTLHHVRVLEASISVSHHSYPQALQDEIAATNTAYEIAIPIESTAPVPVQRAVLRAFLDSVVRQALRSDDVQRFYAELERVRWAPTFGSIPPQACGVAADADVAADARVSERAGEVAAKYRVLRAGAREVYLASYVEEALRAVIGLAHTHRFLRDCLVART